MSWTDRYNDQGYKNWLRVAIALLKTRDGLIDITLQAAKELHAEVKAQLEERVEKCTCNPKKEECKDCNNELWREELEKYYTGNTNRIGWTNCTPSKWSKEPWEVAKVFMPKGQPADNTGPGESDPSGLLNFLVFCKYCKKYFSEEPLKRVLEVRNKAMHFKDLKFDNQTFNEYMDKMVNLLNSVPGPTAQEAAAEISKMKKAVFHIGTDKSCRDAEIRVLTDVMGEQTRLLQLHKEELENHGSPLDGLEEREVEEIRMTVNTILIMVNNNPDLQCLKDQAQAVKVLQDRIDKVEGRVSQLEERAAEHEQKLHQLEAQCGGTMLSSGADEQAFTSALVINYSNTLKTLKPLPWNPRFCLDLDKIFTPLVLVGHHGREDRRMFKSLDDVFDNQPVSGQPSRNVLVVGDAGSGKSTLLSKTALDWSCKKGRLPDMNKIVLLIRLREVHSDKSIAQIVWDQCVTKSAKGISDSCIATCLQDYESKIVFLLDGYDELVQDAKASTQAVPELLAKKLYPACTVMVTSRPSSGIEEYMNIDCTVNVMGFSSALVDKYVPLYFKAVDKPGLADSLVKALDTKANIVARGLIQSPMFLVLICALWEDKPTIVQFPVTMSGLYQLLLACVIRKYCVRERLPKDEVPSEVSTALQHLGKLALESLLKGESLVDLRKTTASQATDVMLKLGIVTKEVSASRLQPREHLNFPHKSMQEFLAGRYVAERVNTFSDELHTLVPMDTVLHQRNLVQFICGHGGNVTSQWLTNLKLYVAQCMPVKKWNEEMEMEVEDLDEEKTLKNLCLMSLYEGNNSQHFPTLSVELSSLEMTIITPSREAAALKYYLDHAPAVPGGRSLTLTIVEKSDGDVVEYLSSLVQKPLPDLQLYLTVGWTSPYHGDEEGTYLCNIGNTLGKLIPFLTNVPDMRSLNLDRTGLTPESYQALGEILPKLSKLEKLVLSDNPVMHFNEIGHLSEGLESSLEYVTAVLSHLSCLEYLILSHNYIGIKGKKPFAAIQQPVASLKVLNLSHNKIGDVCLGSLAAVLHHLSCLEELDLSHNNIGDEGKEPFAAIQQSVVSLKMLNLSHNKIGDVCLGSLAAVLHHLSCLEELDLSHNNIGDEGKEPFAAIQQSVVSLKMLNLSHNKIGDVCLGSLAAVLYHLSCLNTLNLSYNNIRDAKIASLAATLHYAPTLMCVYINDNPFTEMGLKSFAQTIPRMPALESLYLDPLQTVHLDDTVAMSICTMLTQLPVLEWLSLQNISMQAAGFQAVSTAVEGHPTLQQLDYSYECVPEGVNVRSLSPKIKTVLSDEAIAEFLDS